MMGPKQEAQAALFYAFCREDHVHRDHGSETGMRRVMVEVGAPRHNQIAGMAQVIEQVLIQLFVSHTAIEAFDKTVLHWFVWRNPPPVDQDAHKRPNRIERFFSKLKHYRAIATRYAKHDANFLALPRRAATRIQIRAYESVT